MSKKVILMNFGKNKNNKKKIFLISPVRLATITEMAEVGDYVERLESEGHEVHWPIRDTNQNDSVGIRICHDNLQAIAGTDEVHLWYNQGSQGSIFDFGMVFALGKKLVIANKDAIEPTPHKSFENVLLAYSEYI